ncbi:hypothetical protein ACFL6Q_01305 [Candidatus Neomarinimicrobiota bacterium]
MSAVAAREKVLTEKGVVVRLVRLVRLVREKAICSRSGLDKGALKPLFLICICFHHISLLIQHKTDHFMLIFAI